MAATRFPDKPLALLAGRPLVEHVYRRALLCKGLTDLWVATCDREVFDAVIGFGGKATMTAPSHQRCTDRVAEAAHDLEADVVINIQGDEPLVHPDALDALCARMAGEPEPACVNLANVIASEKDFTNRNHIKVVCDRTGRALYMSRQPIPTMTNWRRTSALRQLGMIGFRKSFLEAFSALPPTPLEQAESIDMLRAIEHGYRVDMLLTEHESFGVDTPDDLREAERRLIDDPIAHQLLQTSLTAGQQRSLVANRRVSPLEGL